MKPTRQQVVQKLIGLSEVIPFFPQSELALQLISNAVLAFVSGTAELDWWANKCIEVMPKYDGMPTLRAVYAIGFQPADGQSPTVEIPGYTLQDMEVKYHAREMDENNARFNQYRAEQLLAGPEDSAPLLLPELKHIPAAGPLQFERCFWCLAESPADTWKLSGSGTCPKCGKARPTLKEREQHLANTKTMPRSEADRRAEVAELNRLLLGPEAEYWAKMVREKLARGEN
jgi:hypothetical protein